jgi:hypothetical protein
MIKSKMKIGVCFVAILLMNITFVSTVMAKTDVSTDISKNNVIFEQSPEIKIIKANDTYYNSQVGDTLISYESNSNYTEANMEIKNLTTSEISNFDYKVSIDNGKFKTYLYKDKKLVDSATLTYNILRPGSTKEMLMSSTSQANVVSSSSKTKYKWDGVTFIKGSGIKYKHPDYNTYGVYNYQSFTIKGNSLIHYHIKATTSSAIAAGPGAVAGAAMGAKIGGAYGAGAGALLGLAMGASSGSALLDEQGCIWYWYSQKFATIHIVELVPYISVTKIYAPYYLRVSTYTLWNYLGISNP